MMSSTLRNISSMVQSVSARTGAELGDRIVVAQVHRCVDGNPALVGFFVAAVAAALGEGAGRLADEFLQTVRLFDVRLRRGDGSLRLAVEIVEGGRAVFALAAD